MTVPFLSARRRSRALTEDRPGHSGKVIDTLSMTCPLDVALSLADQKTRGLLDLPQPTAALVVVTGPETSPLSAKHRDRLWSAFGLPVFEQLRGTAGMVVARECEAHDGLHAVNRAEIPEHFEMLGGLCECGNEMPRFRVTAPLAHSAVA